MGASWSDGGGAQINLLWEGIVRSLCVQNISINSTFSGTYGVLGSKVFVIFSQNFFMNRPFSFSVILLLKSMRRFQTNIQALGVRIVETP